MNNNNHFAFSEKKSLVKPNHFFYTLRRPAHESSKSALNPIKSLPFYGFFGHVSYKTDFVFKPNYVVATLDADASEKGVSNSEASIKTTASAKAFFEMPVVETTVKFLKKKRLLDVLATVYGLSYGLLRLLFIKIGLPFQIVVSKLPEVYFTFLYHFLNQTLTKNLIDAIHTESLGKFQRYENYKGYRHR